MPPAQTLTAEQKLAGRAFRGQCQEKLALGYGEEGVAFCPPFVVWYRHECQRASTWALYLRQHYWTSPDGFFAFIWREGTCRRCGFIARSGTGRFCLAADNPPEKGALVGNPD